MNDPQLPETGQKTEELALLGHDIRSAVVDILAGLELIDDSALTPANRQQLDRARASSEGLVRLLEEGLTTLLAPAQLSLAPYAPAPMDLPRLIADLERRWAYAPDGTRVISLHVADTLPAQVMTSQTAIERVLSNLLSNALHHSNPKRVVLEIFLTPDQELCFSIHDHGPGFPETVTQAYAPAASALPQWQNADGHGLGLRIAQGLSQRIGGRLTLQNHAAGGGLAQFYLPLQPQADSAAADAASPDLTGRRVLVADDSPAQLMLIRQVLVQSGAEVTMVRDGTEADSALRGGEFDLALLDLEMPGRSGLEVLAGLSSLSPRPRLVVLTAHSAPDVMAKARAAGADFVLRKPITSARDLAAALTGLVPTPPIAASFVRLLEIAGPETAAELVSRFGMDLADVQIKLVAAFPVQDWPTLRSASHVLIALAGTAGAKPLEEMARRLNTAATDANRPLVESLAQPVLKGLADLIAFVTDLAQRQPCAS